jgi:transposase, IS5 family
MPGLAPSECGRIRPNRDPAATLSSSGPLVDVERMLRIYFLQQWFNLSDPAVEEALYDSLAMRRFVGIDLGREPVPGETTVCHFRHLLKHGGTLEKAAAMANHASTSATQLYDRRRDELTLDGRADSNSISVSSRSGSSERRTPDPAGI